MALRGGGGQEVIASIWRRRRQRKTKPFPPSLTWALSK